MFEIVNITICLEKQESLNNVLKLLIYLPHSEEIIADYQWKGSVQSPLNMLGKFYFIELLVKQVDMNNLTINNM
uniref:Uncharacterized protein LOC105117893 isoform X2 n=1 Tax=Rhizophora mucronata TaxID=61149 RepID=A0A2P2K789_RHIMU